MNRGGAVWALASVFVFVSLGADADGCSSPGEGGGASRAPAPRMLLPGTEKLHGSNIVPKVADVGWRTFYRDWDWEGWIKPQIDRVAGAGGNAIRLIGDYGGVIWGAVSRDAYLAQVAQFTEYARSRGLWVYLAGGDAGANSWQHVHDPASARPTSAQIADEVSALAGTAAKYDNVVALDISQEINGHGLAPPQMLALATELQKAVRNEAPNLPVTFSYTGAPNAGSVSFLAAFAPLVDFFDFHVYTTEAPDLQAYFASTEKPLVLGEFGSAKSNDDATRDAFYAHWAQVVWRAKIAGSFSWAIQDQSAAPAGNYGMWDNAGNPTSVLAHWRGMRSQPVWKTGR